MALRSRSPNPPGQPGGAVVTGAARGMGLAIARMLHARGYVVDLADVDREGAESAAAELGEPAGAATLDVRDSRACREAAAEAEHRAGSLDVWVNNAGVLIPGSPWDQPEEAVRLMIDVNAVGTMNGTLAALGRMRPRGRGHVINVVSMAGIVASPGETVYGASKHAALAFSLGTLADLRLAGERDLHISCVCPDGVWTAMLEDKLEDPSAAASFSGTMLLPEQVAARVEGLLGRPRPVVTMPRRRGALLRMADVWPGLGLRSAGPTLARGRKRQREFARKVHGGTWPPR
jgi:NAD(P)-dependent dehydrogenase (short-subunit alcohol dehydrogenase family)